MRWRNISLKQYQLIEDITENEDYDELDKDLYCACLLFDVTEHQMNSKKPEDVESLLQKTRALFAQPFPKKYYSRIGFYKLDYDPDKWRFGQYIELMHFLKQPNENAHLVLASIAHYPLLKNKSETHDKRANYFLTVPITKVAGCVGYVQDTIKEFNKRFPDLFDLLPEEEVEETEEQDELTNEDQEIQQAPVSSFDEFWGWEYAAKQVATHEGIKKDEAYDMPARIALTTLTYLKAEREHEKLLMKNATS